MDSKLAYVIALFGLMSGFTALPIQQSSHHQKIIEGDILVTAPLRELMSLKHRTKREITSKIIKRWPNNVVPYVVDSALGKFARRAIRHAIKQFHEHTCIQFVRRTNQDDYIAFQRDIGCYSPIGRQGGRQKLAVGDECEQKGTIMHELMHALGFFHEQSRYDRDKYVKILWWNIEPDFMKNFESYSHDDLDTMGIPYDYNSLMHYEQLAFSKNRQNTIEAIDDANRPLGQMEKFSEKDIKQLLMAYKCKSIDKDPLPAQPLRTSGEKEHEDPIIGQIVKTSNEQRHETDKVQEPTTATTEKYESTVEEPTEATKDKSHQENVGGTVTRTKGKCKDMYPVACKKFASVKGYCEYWKGFMEKTCPLACGIC